MTLKDLHKGDTAVIQQIHGTGAFRKRITEMGFVSGQPVKMIRSGPLNGPLEFRIMSGTVTLRRNEAGQIDIFRPGSTDMPGGPVFDPIYTESLNSGEGVTVLKKIKVAFVGNPNSGKTTLYNRLSRSNERVGNYSGVTVGSKEVMVDYKGYEFSFVDLPGTYSLSAYSEEEVVVRDFLSKERPDIVVNVIDAGNIERHLYLTTQLIDMGVQVVIALNMWDDLNDRGDKLDVAKLASLVGIPIVPTIGKRGKGLYRLLNRVIQVMEDREPVIRHTHINYGPELERSIHKVESLLKRHEVELKGRHLRYFAIRTLERDDYCMHTLSSLEGFEEIRLLVNDELVRLNGLFKEDPETLISNARYAFIGGALKETYKKGKRDRAQSRTQRIDRVLMNKYFGFVIFLGIIFGMFQATFGLGQYPMNWIDAGVGWLGSMLSGALPEGIVADFLIDGIIGGVGGVIIFLPNILILFFIISLMEDTGYMARTAYIMDPVMHLFGLHGKSFIPMIMGFGCNVPAMMATRMLENRRDRLLTMLIIPFMSCTARLPVYILIAGAVFPDRAGMVIFSMYLIGILFSIIMSLIFKSTIFREKEAPFVMELPPYRAPGMRMVFRHMWFKAWLYLKKMGTVILVASVIIWALGYFPQNNAKTGPVDLEIATLTAQMGGDEVFSQSDEMTGSVEQDAPSVEYLQVQLDSLEMLRTTLQQEGSVIGIIGKGIEPLIRPLGFDWKMGVSLLAGFAAKEVVVSTMGVLYQVQDAEEDMFSLQEKLRVQEHQSGKLKGELIYTPLAAFTFLLFVLLYIPCVSVIATVGREAGSWKWSALVVFYTTFLAWFVSFCVYRLF